MLQFLFFIWILFAIIISLSIYFKREVTNLFAVNSFVKLFLSFSIGAWDITFNWSTCSCMKVYFEITSYYFTLQREIFYDSH